MDINKVHNGGSRGAIIIEIAATSRDMHRTVIHATYHNNKQGSDPEQNHIQQDSRQQDNAHARV